MFSVDHVNIGVYEIVVSCGACGCVRIVCCGYIRVHPNC